MKLPFADQAVVPNAKILGYLLNEAHPTGRGKAEFFARLGFRHDEPETFRRALRRVARETDVEEVASPFGRKFVGLGEVRGPVGRNPKVLTVWMLREGRPPPILVTAYPA